MSPGECITVIGILTTLGVSVFNLINSYRHNKKTAFINSVTSSRLKYIQDLRNAVASFCGLVNSYSIRSEEITPSQKWELTKESDRLKFLIRLHLNPIDVKWDHKISPLLDEIINLTDKDPEQKIKDLIELTQYILKLEWEGVKLESEKGILSERAKKALSEKYMMYYNGRVSL